MLPPPSQIIDNPKFSSWFPGQEKIAIEILDWLQSDKRFLCANVPTGFGKSIITLVDGWLSGGKVVYMTATKGLQGQLLEDGRGVGMRRIEGQNSYTCIASPPLTVDRASCHTGLVCPVKGSCEYYEALDEAKSARMVVTNYHYWLAQNHYGDGLSQSQEYPLVIMDEGHLAGRALENHLTVSFTYQDLDRFGVATVAPEWSWEQWQLSSQRIASELWTELQTVKGEAMSKPSPTTSRKYHQVKSLHMRMLEIAGATEEWIREVTPSNISLCPLWPRTYNHRLFKGDKILIMSATLTRKGMDKLGVPEGDTHWIDAPSPFDPGNSPVHHLHSIRVDSKPPPENMVWWARKIDQIIEGRMGRKGIVFTVSYQRAQLLQRLSEHSDIMFVHGSKDLVSTVERFKKSPAPAILVSPSVTSGWDFPGTECEYIIIGKVPWPDSRGELMKARTKEDRDWGAFLAMESVVQEAGRGTRSQQDRCEIFVVDDNWVWFWHKYREYSPYWFQQRVKGSLDMVPEILERR